MHYYIGNKKSWQLTSAFLISSLFVSMIYYQTSKTDTSFKPTWTAKAAEEAEAVAAIYCSGHGRAFFDGRYSKGVHVCECNNCYSGSDCSVLDTENCIADAVTGDAMFLENYWLENKSRSAVVIPGWHRMSYYFNPYSEPFTSFELEHHIRRLHEVVGNAKVDDKHIVFGNGVTQLLTGLVIALSQHRLPLPNVVAKVVAQVPYYPVFRKQTTFFRYKGYRWAGNATDYIHTKYPQDFIELVTSPNNPDGNLKVARIRGARAIYDRVYYWPHYTAISHQLADDDIMLFSMSKLTGHAGSRFGWALIRNLEVYKNLTQYMVESSEGTSHDTQLRTLGIVKEIVKQFNTPESSNDIFKFGYQTLRRRWKILNELVSYAPSKRFSLQVLRKQDCFYFGKNRDPSPAFGWLKCEWEEDMDCAAVLKDGNILTQGGELFDTSRCYARLSLIKTEDDFDQMMEKLKSLLKAKRIRVHVNE